MAETVYTRDEAAAILKCSVRHVDELVARGELEKIKLGPKLARYSASSIREYISRETARATSGRHPQ